MLSKKAQQAMETVVTKLQTADLGPLVNVALLRPDPASDRPADHWSPNNRLLAFLQTGTLDCRGYRQWQAAGRQVQAGSTAAYILGPCTRTTTTDDGEEETTLCGFRGIPVFAINDTAGDPIPEPDYTPPTLPPLADIAAALEIKITYTPLDGQTPGQTDTRGRYIALATHDEKTFYHELAHAIHARIQGPLKGGQHADQETIAELTAAILAYIYGNDRTANAWHYISSYNTEPIKAITAALETTQQIITFIESLQDHHVPSTNA